MFAVITPEQTSIESKTKKKGIMLLSPIPFRSYKVHAVLSVEGQSIKTVQQQKKEKKKEMKKKTVKI